MKVYILNGYPRSGKDTFFEMVRKLTNVTDDNRAYIWHLSSVDMVKKCAVGYFGWDGETKDAYARKLLSDLKDFMTDHGDLPFKYLCEYIETIKSYSKLADDRKFVFIDIREPEEIERAKKHFNAQTIFIDRTIEGEKEQSNHADSNVSLYRYDYYIDNNGSLKDLEDTARGFALVEDII